MNINEFAPQSYPGDSRLRDTTELTDNERVIITQSLSYLGLEYDKDGELVRRRITYRDENNELKAYFVKPMISLEGAIRLVDSILRPFLSPLAGFTNLSKDEIRDISKSFAQSLAKWLWQHRETYDISEPNIKMIHSNLPWLVFLQLSRSREGESNLMTQVMGNTSKQILVRGGEQEATEYTQQQQPRRWGFGSIFGR